MKISTRVQYGMVALTDIALYAENGSSVPAPEIAEREPNALLLLIGEGDGKATVQEQAQRLNASEKVIFYGATENVPPLLSAMDVFVFPSRFEGCGNALLEAQAAGLPCFASKDVIPKDVAVTPLLHWVSLSDGPGTWAEAILSNRDSALRQAHNTEIIQAGYDLAAMADRLKKIYHGVRESEISRTL